MPGETSITVETLIRSREFPGWGRNSTLGQNIHHWSSLQVMDPSAVGQHVHGEVGDGYRGSVSPHTGTATTTRRGA